MTRLPALLPFPVLVPVLVLVAATLLASSSLPAAMKGDCGWSADGRKYGFCDPQVQPDAFDGCYFFDREKLEWVETSRRETVKAWQVWKGEPDRAFAKPLLPVYPLDAGKQDTGEVRLKARIMSTDDVVEIWRLRKAEGPDEVGSQWETLFEYSPDGRWIAAGAVRVDFGSSGNSLHVVIRPVGHWLALAHLRAGLARIGEGEAADGLASLGRAGAFLDGALKGQGYEPEPLARRKKPLADYVEGDEGFLGATWIEKMARALWSPDGKKFCACDAWENDLEGRRASCRVYDVKKSAWTPLMTDQVQFVCPEPKAQAAGRPAPFPYTFWADWGGAGPEGKTRVVLYMIGAKEGRLGAVLAKDVREEPENACEEGPGGALFHPVGIPSPLEYQMAVGFAEESWNQKSLRYHLEIDSMAAWESKAEADRDAFQPAKPKLIEKVTGLY